VVQIRDQMTHPLTVVECVDLVTPNRVVNLPAQEAVLYCVASDAGDPGNTAPFLESLIFARGWWHCGKYKARDNS
jgi:hypothetical protein